MNMHEHMNAQSHLWIHVWAAPQARHRQIEGRSQGVPEAADLPQLWV
jgi:hypothetical protein